MRHAGYRVAVASLDALSALLARNKVAAIATVTGVAVQTCGNVIEFVAPRTSVRRTTMASEWVKCTGGAKEPIYLNIGLATEMVPTEGGTFVFFVEKRVLISPPWKQGGAGGGLARDER